MSYDLKKYVRPGLTEKDLKEIQDAFNLFDKDKSGTIDMSELNLAMESLGVQNKDVNLMRAMADGDTNKSGGIDFEEFLDMITGKLASLENKEQCLKYFNLYDEDKDGKISFQNLKKVAIEIGETMSDAELLNMIKKMDTDGDGEISFDEFAAVMYKSAK